MSAGPSSGLYVAGRSPVHRLPPHTKLVALLGFVLVVAVTPRQLFWAFGAYAVLLAAVGATAGLRPALVLRRMTVEIPFVAFAVLLPFLSAGPHTEVLGVTLSESGVLGAWTILAKGTLGVAASVVLAATTEPRSLLLGLEQLRMPSLLVQILGFMFRYADVVSGEMARMRVARESRGFHGRTVKHLGVVAHSAGALFIRSYERGERVHLAMLSRGYTGRMPSTLSAAAAPADWARAGALPLAAAAVCLVALLARP